jgi:hypothetical protein
VSQPKKGYFCSMFIRKKNPSDVISVQIIDKSSDKYHVVKTIGNGSDTSDIEKLYQQGKKWLLAYLGERDIFAGHTRKKKRNKLQKRCCPILEIF